MKLKVIRLTTLQVRIGHDTGIIVLMAGRKMAGKPSATSRECSANFGFSRDLWRHFRPTSTCCNLEQPDFRRFRSSTSNTLFQNPLTDLPSIIYIILVFIFFRQYKFINLIPYITDLTPSPTSTSPWKAGSQVCKLYISRHWRGVLCPIN